ncbi:hypothetical protein QR98_0024610 [Sarcoptes scabiei]|uniref:Histone-lysine N-methyltransferase, H3 lysine-79 specific n=1 Tax=Sarcoptes scabiei TaxID=52283 RepID=A0A131ZYT4_SARSC|nr:hypothetical protein QR98_0024610 [Sarcoptes scabiei]
MEKNFRFWFQWFGLTYSDFTIYRGDFFDEKYLTMITGADFIFVNNFAFGPSVDHKLKGYFENLKDGSKILSSKAFCSLNFSHVY